MLSAGSTLEVVTVVGRCERACVAVAVSWWSRSGGRNSLGRKQDDGVMTGGTGCKDGRSDLIRNKQVGPALQLTR